MAAHDGVLDTACVRVPVVNSLALHRPLWLTDLLRVQICITRFRDERHQKVTNWYVS